MRTRRGAHGATAAAVLCGLLLAAPPAAGDMLRVGAKADPLQSTVLNALQLNVRSLLDNIVPNLALPDFPPAVAVAASGKGKDTTPGDKFAVLGKNGAKLLAPFDRLLSACPVCGALGAQQLAGTTWHWVYASDNMLKARVPALERIYDAFYPSPAQTNGQTSGKAKGNGTLGAKQLHSLLMPVRMPLCAAIKFSPRASGNGQSIAGRLQFRLGTHWGKVVALPVNATVRHGKGVRLTVDRTLYTIDWCPITSNLPSAVFPTPIQPSTPQHFTTVQDPGTKILLMADANSNWPPCNNYLLMVTQRGDFFNRFDTNLAQYMRALGADTNGNPIRYLGCPPT